MLYLIFANALRTRYRSVTVFPDEDITEVLNAQELQYSDRWIATAETLEQKNSLLCGLRGREAQ